MNIESSHPTKGAHTSIAESKHAKGKSAAGDAGAPGGDFLALLASMDPSVVVEAVIDPLAAEGLANASSAAASSLASLTKEDSARLTESSDFPKFADDLNTQATIGLGPDAGLESDFPGKSDEEPKLVEVSHVLLDGIPYAQVPPSVPLAPAAPPRPLAADGPILAPDTQLEVLFGATARDQVNVANTAFELPAKLQSGAIAAQPQAGRDQAPSGLPVGLVANRPAPVSQPDAALTAFGPLLSAGVDSGGKTSKLQRDLAKQESMHGTIVSALSKSTNELDARVNLAHAKPAEQALTQLTPFSLLATTLMPVRREELVRERSAFRPGLTENNSVGQSLFSVAGSSSVQYTPEIPAFTEQQIAEKVAYWVSNDVQSAELKLDGLGLEPIEVTIRMQGNEAHVAFRTDELQARAALENAGVHLKDLLLREGLVLSGVSVGTAGTGDSGTQDRKPRQGMRQAVVAPAISTLAERVPSPTRVAGGALDLFV